MIGTGSHMRQLHIVSLLGAGAIGVAALTAGPVAAQVKDRVVIIYGNDKCPANNGQEIVVCKRAPETERFRIPKDLRDAEPTPQAAGGNANALNAVATTGGTGVQVQSCNAIGAGVSAGCLTNELSNWKAQQNAQKKADAGVP
jgi:hypothetical protein